MSLKRTASQEGEALKEERPLTKLKLDPTTSEDSVLASRDEPLSPQSPPSPFPSSHSFPALQPPDLSGDDLEKEEEDIILEPEPQELLPPFPSSHKLDFENLEDGPVLGTAENLDEDIILDGEEEGEDMVSSETRSSTLRVESSGESDVEEVRGIDGLALDPLRAFYESDKLERAEEDQVVRYPYDEGLNERVAVW